MPKLILWIVNAWTRCACLCKTLTKKKTQTVYQAATVDDLGRNSDCVCCFIYNSGCCSPEISLENISDCSHEFPCSCYSAAASVKNHRAPPKFPLQKWRLARGIYINFSPHFGANLLYKKYFNFKYEPTSNIFLLSRHSKIKLMFLILNGADLLGSCYIFWAFICHTQTLSYHNQGCSYVGFFK